MIQLIIYLMQILITALSHINLLNNPRGVPTKNEEEDFNMDSFDKRLFYQKIIFLLKEKTHNLHYNFNWYKRGPYSPDLTRDLYSIKSIMYENPSSFEILIQKGKRFAKALEAPVKSIISLKENFKNSFKRSWNSNDLEIMASLVYINHYTYSKCKKSAKETFNEFYDRKPEYKKVNIKKYWDLMSKNDFVN